MPCTWKECITHFTDHQPWLNDADKALIMGQAMADWIGWNRPSAGRRKSAGG